MANENQARRTPEREISVDLSEGDPAKAVSRRAPRSDIASQVRDDDDRGSARGGKRSKTEEELFKRMTRMQRSMTKQFNQRLADQQAEHQREIAALRTGGGSGVSIDRDAAQLKDAHEKAMAELEKQLADANEKGDSAAAAAITAKMIKADGEYHAKLAGTAVRRDAGGADPNAGKGGAGTGADGKARAAGPTPAGSRFILANEDWWEDPEFEIEKAAASTIFLKLINEEGFTSNSDETFKEVGRRLKSKFPELPVAVAGGKKVSQGGDGDGDGDDLGDGGDGLGDGDDDDDEEARQQQRTQRRAASARIADRGAAGGRNNGNRRTLTSEEIKTMRNVGLNPENDKDVLSFLREAVALENARA